MPKTLLRSADNNLISGIFLFLTCILPQLAFTQNSDAPKEVSNVYFFENVNIVQKPGTTLPLTNMTIRNGIIEDIGKHIKKPADAIGLKVDSMFIYAGFIDAFSHTGIPKPENKDTPKIPDPGNPPNDVAGITPDLNCVDFFNAGDKSVADWRSAGFTMVHVIPRGYMLPGQSGIFHLSEGRADELLVKNKVGMAAQFTTNRSVYPSTVIGVIAKFRELYNNAVILDKNQVAYEINPLGMNRPMIKKEELALKEVTKGQQAVYFHTTQPHHMYRALSLQKELGFRLTLANVKDGDELISLIQQQKTDIILSLDLPEALPEAKKGKKDEKPISEEERAFEERRKSSIQSYEGQASRFEKSKMPFTFSGIDVKPGDALKNIRRMVKAGLSETTALAALTTLPAEKFGLSKSVGTIEKGKLANLIICDTTIFNEKVKLKWVMIEGRLFENVIQEKKEKGNEDTPGWAGTWTYSVDVNGTQHTGKLTVIGKNEVSEIVVITDDNPGAENKATQISQKGKQLKFSILFQADGGMMAYEVDITLEKSLFSGSVNVGSMGSFTISGEKKSGPNQI